MRNYFKKIQQTAKYYFRKFRKLSFLKQALLVVAVLFAVQLFIPTGTTSLLSRLDGRSTALLRYATLEKKYAQTATNVEVAFGSKKLSIPASDLGYNVDAAATLQQIPHVTLSDKFIPLWPYVKILQPKNVHTKYAVNTAQRSAYIRTMSTLYSVSPSDAKVSVNDKLDVRVIDDVDGYTYSVASIDTALKNPNFYGTKPIVITGEKVTAKRTPDDLQEVVKQYKKLTDTPLAVTYANKQTTLAPDVYVITLEVQGDPSKPIVQFSEQGMQSIVLTLAKTYGLASGIDTTNATADTAINVDAFKKSIALWLTAPTEKPISLPTVVVQTASSKSGLQSAVTSWVQQHGTGYYVVVQEIGGSGRSAVYNASQSTVLASTYKLFVAWAAYRLAEQGQLSLGTVVYNGMSIEQCIARAIINSDNECAKAIGKYIGWAKIQGMVTTAGFSSLRLNNYFADGSFDGDKTGNASDLAKFLRQLQAGTLINSAHTNTLLGYMEQQVYRSGVPAGSAGSTVADKVGFLASYTHDAAIVYGPKSTYVVVVMSDKGNNWVNIKSLASAVYNNLN